MQKIVLLLTFWCSPEDENSPWLRFSQGRPYTEDDVLHIMALIINEIDDKFVDWSALDEFKAAQMQNLLGEQNA